MRLNDRAVRNPVGQWHPHRFPIRFIKSVGLNLIFAGIGLNLPG
jgi:hypothetical protein